MIIQKPTITFENSNHTHADSANGGALGAVTATSINGLTISTSTGTLTITNGKTVSFPKTMTLTASGDSAVITLPNATVTFASPGTSGNVMTSDGTNWTSAPAAGGANILQMQIFF